jgi:hypothetical protein
MKTDADFEYLLYVHQEMLDMINKGIDPIPVPYTRMVDWFNTVKVIFQKVGYGC